MDLYFSTQMSDYYTALTMADYLLICVEIALALTALIKIKNIKIKLSFSFFALAAALWHISLSSSPSFYFSLSDQFQLLELLRYMSWLLLLIYLLMYSQKTRLPWRWNSFILISISLLLLFWLGSLNNTLSSLLHPRLWVYIKIISCLIAIVVAEQLLRYQHTSRVSKLVALVAITQLGFDMLVFSNLLLFNSESNTLWQARAMVSSTTSLILACAIIIYPFKQRQENTFQLSHSIIIFNTSLILAGIFLISMALLGIAVDYYDAQWTKVSKILLYVMSIFAIAALSCLEKFRLWVTVWISKNFFSNKYDYQKQWIKLDELLSQKRDDNDGYEVALAALTTLFNCKSGGIWLKGPQFYSPIVLKNFTPASSRAIEANNTPFIQLLADNEWVFQAPKNSNTYDEKTNQHLPKWFVECPNAWVVMPLSAYEGLIGFAVLCKEELNNPLTWEDLDILKLTGRQVGSYLSHYQASKKLAQNQQFDLFNKITAFAIHDIKNLIAQQSLMLNNAEKFKQQPEFVNDVILTVSNSVKKMQQLLVKLQGNPHGKLESVNINKLLETAIEMNASLNPHPELYEQGETAWVMADRDKLQMAFYHLIKNAQEATADNGKVTIKSKTENNALWLEVQDTGCGMDKKFIEEQLFKPFISTKKASGMGIGAYQIRELIHSLQGEIFVESVVGKGTNFSIYLPLNRPD